MLTSTEDINEIIYRSVERESARFEGRENKILTLFEEVDSSMISSNVEPGRHEPIRLEPKLRHIVPSIIAKEQYSSWFQHLSRTNQYASRRSGEID